MEGDFKVHLMKNGEHYDEDDFFAIKFYENYDLSHDFETWKQEITHSSSTFDSYGGSNWHWDRQKIADLKKSIECSAFLQNQQGYLVQDDAEQDAIRLSVDVAISFRTNENACNSTI